MIWVFYNEARATKLDSALVSGVAELTSASAERVLSKYELATLAGLLRARLDRTTVLPSKVKRRYRSIIAGLLATARK